MNHNPTTAYEQYNLGKAYEHGMYDCPEDLEKAIYWYAKAYGQGLDVAYSALFLCQRQLYKIRKDKYDQAISNGDYGRAISLCDEAIRLDSNDALAYIERGTVYLKNKKDYGKAINDFETALRIAPTSRDAQQMLGEAKTRLKFSQPPTY
jgi:tetratricopeptide (TPR) repeat protein